MNFVSLVGVGEVEGSLLALQLLSELCGRNLTELYYIHLKPRPDSSVFKLNRVVANLPSMASGSWLLMEDG